MMQRRIKKKAIGEVSPRGDTVKVRAIPIENSIPLVTLEHPDEGAQAARGAFARLRPPEGLTPTQIDSWRDSVARVAKAVKVLPAPRSADVPDAAQRIDDSAPIKTIRQEAMTLAEDTKNPGVVECVKVILDRIGVA